MSQWRPLLGNPVAPEHWASFRGHSLVHELLWYISHISYSSLNPQRPVETTPYKSKALLLLLAPPKIFDYNLLRRDIVSETWVGGRIRPEKLAEALAEATLIKHAAEHQSSSTSQ